MRAGGTGLVLYQQRQDVKSLCEYTKAEECKQPKQASSGYKAALVQWVNRTEVVQCYIVDWSVTSAAQCKKNRSGSLANSKCLYEAHHDGGGGQCA